MSTRPQFELGLMRDLGKGPSLNRKTEWSRKRREQGLCFCGRPLQGKSLCPEHMEIQKHRMRARSGYKGHTGRAAQIAKIEHTPIPNPARVRSAMTDKKYRGDFTKLQSLVPESFIRHVAFQGRSSCWLWTGSSVPNPRYPHIKYGCHSWSTKINGKWRSRGKSAHKVSWEAINGPVPDGKELDHLCEVHLCVNPWHVEAVTHQENVVRGFMRRKGVGLI
jgi:hypothetical protein